MSRRRPRLRTVAVIAAVLLASGAVAGYFALRPPGDVFNPQVEFEEPTPTATPAPERRSRGGRRADRFRWPVYGFTKDHRRTFPASASLRGPYRQMWKIGASALLEFPPVIARGRLFQLADDGLLRAVDKRTGRIRWRRDLGRLAASTPAAGRHTLYVTLLETRASRRRGRVAAVRMRDGKVLWSRTLPSRSESSPMIDGGKIYFGTEDGTVYALRARNGRTVWTYRAAGAVKASLTLSGRTLYFGDYSGRVQAIRTVNGRRVWSSSVARGLRSGRFYATAAVAYGRVYVGSTDGRQYSLSARTGRLAWARQTGGFVYSSAAVATAPGVGPTVYFGSYDGRFYALDARTGRTRWTFRSGGKISGSPTIVGDVVYFSDLGRSRTYGLGIRTGRRVFRANLGGYDPIVSDGRSLFLTGRRSVTRLTPLAAGRREARERSRARAKARAKTPRKQKKASGKKERRR